MNCTSVLLPIRSIHRSLSSRIVSGLSAPLMVLLLLVSFLLPILPTADAYAVNDRYWVGGSGNWSDNATHWSLTSNGAAGADLPDATTDVHFDNLSFTGLGQTVTLDVATSCNKMDWTGSMFSPVFALGVGLLTAYSDITFIPTMTYTTGGGTIQINVGGVCNLTTNGMSATPPISVVGGSLTLLDDWNCGNFFLINSGSLTTNGNSVTTPDFSISGAGAKTVTLGSSTVNIASAAGWHYSGTNLTLTANTATMNIAGTGAFAGGNIATYNTVNLNGTAHTITGNNTVAVLYLSPTATQTITFTDDTTQTIGTAATLSGTSGNVHTLQGSGVLGWRISKAAGIVNADYISVSRSTAAGGATFNANGDSINGGNNVGWNFPLTATTAAATGVAYGVTTTATLNGAAVNLGGTGATTARFEWGYTSACSSGSTANQALTAPATITGTITGFVPGTIYYRTAITSGGSTAYGSVVSFSTTTGSGSSRGNTAAYLLLYGALPLAIAVGVCVGAFMLFRGGGFVVAMINVALGLVAYVVILALVRALF